MNNVYAVVEKSVVVNTIIWDGTNKWAPEYGLAIQADDSVSIGWFYNGNTFTAPVAPEKSHDELVSEAEVLKNSMLLEANTKIVPYQDSIELGIGTDSEAALYNKWREYRVLLNRINTSAAPNIDWPVMPSI